MDTLLNHRCTFVKRRIQEDEYNQLTDTWEPHGSSVPCRMYVPDTKNRFTATAQGVVEIDGIVYLREPDFVIEQNSIMVDQVLDASGTEIAKDLEIREVIEQRGFDGFIHHLRLECREIPDGYSDI